MFEKVLESKCLDIYRLTNGVLFKVYKCKFISYIYCTFNKRKHEKIVENVYITKEEILLRALNAESVIPVGAYIVENNWVEPTEDYKEFRFELKTTGDAFSGNIKDMNKYLSYIDTIMSKYMK